MLARQQLLTSINLDDMTAALGLLDRPVMARLARTVLRGPAETFARRMLEFDELTGTDGLPHGARHVQRALVRDVRVFGRENLPEGGFLALSNHPGFSDTLALFSAIDRKDLYTIALDRPFLMSLKNVSSHLFYLPASSSERVALVRKVARALRSGTPVLTFPAGRIEPDPEIYAGAEKSLETWLESAEMFVRMAPGTPIVPICVGGVTWRALAKSGLVRLRKSASDQQLLTSALQLMLQMIAGLRLVTVNVQIGRPIREGSDRTAGAASLHREILEGMRLLIRRVPQRGWSSGL